MRGRWPSTGPIPANTDSEKWLPIVGQESNYLVSDCGRVYSIRNMRMLKLSNGIRSGKPYYFSATLPDRGLVFVHCLMMESFVGPRPVGHEVNHKDGNKQNNHLNNLEYVTKSENAKHAHRLGLSRVYHDRRRGTKLMFLDSIAIFLCQDRHAVIADRYGISESLIEKIKSGVVWSRTTKYLTRTP